MYNLLQRGQFYSKKFWKNLTLLLLQFLPVLHCNWCFSVMVFGYSFGIFVLKFYPIFLRNYGVFEVLGFRNHQPPVCPAVLNGSCWMFRDMHVWFSNNTSALWQAYIDFEIAEGEFENTRALYERLLDRTKHLKAWISYAKFEASAAVDKGESDMPEDETRELFHEKRKLSVQRARRKHTVSFQ